MARHFVGSYYVKYILEYRSLAQVTLELSLNEKEEERLSTKPFSKSSPFLDTRAYLLLRFSIGTIKTEWVPIYY